MKGKLPPINNQDAQRGSDNTLAPLHRTLSKEGVTMEKSQPESLANTPSGQSPSPSIASAGPTLDSRSIHEAKLKADHTIGDTAPDGDDEEDQELVVNDIEESRRQVAASISERGAASMARDNGDPSDKPKWPVNDELFELPDNSVWPNLTKNDSEVYGWVFNKGAMLTRLVTWNLMASPPPSPEVVSEDLIPKNMFHMYAIGTEECERTIAQSAINTSKDQWEDYLKKALGPMYVPVKSHTLQVPHPRLVFVKNK